MEVRIICLLLDGTKRFSELRRNLPGIHRGTLTYELWRLEAHRIVHRTQYPVCPSQVVVLDFLEGCVRDLEVVFRDLVRHGKQFKLDASELRLHHDDD